MKFIYLLALSVFLAGCSPNKKHSPQSEDSDTGDPTAFPLDSLLRLHEYREVIHFYSIGYDQRDNEKYGKLLHGAWIQTIGDNYPYGEISCVSVGLVREVDMPRMLNMPRWWQTRTGIHVGMSLDSVQLLNGGSFTITIDTAGRYTDSWDNGKLADTFTEVHFETDPGVVFSPGKTSSQEILNQGLKVKVKGFIVWKPEYWPYRLKGTHLLPGYYLFTSTRLLNGDDVVDKDSRSLSLMRHEIFARKGYTFSDPAWRDFFNGMNWYKPANTHTPTLSDIERANANYIWVSEQFLSLGAKTSWSSIISNLPVLSLPFHVEANWQVRRMLPAGMPVPDGAETGTLHRSFVYGLLADTSRFYAVLWLGSSDKNPEADRAVFKVTTYNKQSLLPIATGNIRVQQQVDFNPKKCWADFEDATIVNPDLTFKSVLTAKISYAQDTTKRQTVRVAFGRINRNGTIQAEEADQ